MIASRKKFIQKKQKKGTKPKPAIVDLEEQPALLSITVDEGTAVLLCQPHKHYKVRGIQKILYCPADFVIDDAENEYMPNPNVCILQVAENEQEHLYQKLVQKMAETNLDATNLRSIKPHLHTSIPILVQSTFLTIEQTHPPWPEEVFSIIRNTIKSRNQKQILITGNKNTGKSSLSSFFLRSFLQQNQTVCLLDLDLGKGRGLPATINLYRYSSKDEVETTTYWVGQYTPLNYYELYIKSVKKLISKYRAQHFDDVLVVNTMGYLTGLGELLMIELYNLIQPSQVVFLSKDEDPQLFQRLKTSLNNTQNRLKLTRVECGEFASAFNFVVNYHAVVKHDHALKSQSFESHLGINSLEDLLFLRLPQLNFNRILIQTYNGQVIPKIFDPRHTDLQLLVICDIEDFGLYKFKGLGYGFQGKIYAQAPGEVCIKSEIVEFSKQFYKLNEKQLISLEQTIESELPYVSPIYRGLGSMGYRNLSSKKLRN